MLIPIQMHTNIRTMQNAKLICHLLYEMFIVLKFSSGMISNVMSDEKARHM